MPTYHFVAKVPLTAHTTVKANSLEEAMEKATSEDREVIFAEDGFDAAIYIDWKWVIREVDEGPQDIQLGSHKPIIP